MTPDRGLIDDGTRGGFESATLLWPVLPGTFDVPSESPEGISENDFRKEIKTDAEWFERISRFHNETLTDYTVSAQAIERDFKCVAMGTCGKQIYICITANLLYLIEHNYMYSKLL